MTTSAGASRPAERHAEAAADAERRQPAPRPAARISCSSVTRIRVPVQPMGWPSAIAPPLTFTRARSIGRSRSTASTCGANASFSSTRSKSSSVRPVLREQLAHRRHRADPHDARIDAGRRPADNARERREPAARRPRRSSASTTAAPPSVMPDDVPAVMMPGRAVDRFEHQRQLAQALDRRARARMLVDRELHRLALGVVPRRRRDFVREPARGDRALRLSAGSRARTASDSSRVMPYCRASTSAVCPMTSCDSGSKNPSRYIASTSAKLPILWPQRASSLSSRYGMRLIDSMPPASTMRDWPSLNRLRAERDGLQSRRARLIDRLRGHVVGQARRGGRPAAPDSGPDPACRPWPNQHFVDVARRDSRARERRARRARAEFSRMSVAKRAAVAANGRARGADDDNVGRTSTTYN